MHDKIQNGEVKNSKMSLFDYFTEVVGWLQIVASPLLFGLVTGACIYFYNPTIVRLITGIGIAFTGLIVGIVFATRIWKKQGTVHFISRLIAIPELDSTEEDKT